MNEVMSEAPKDMFDEGLVAFENENNTDFHTLYDQ